MALVAASLLAAPAMGAIDFGADDAPNPTYEYDLEKAEHDMQWGTSHSDALTYEDDDGEVAEIDGEVNTSEENPYSFVVTDLETDEFTEFPRSDDDVSVIDDANWSADGDASVGTTETADGVDALHVSTDGLADGEEANVSFDLSEHDAELTDDEEKRYLQVPIDVETLDGSAEIQVIDEDGDKKVAELNSSLTASDDGVVADSTGDGWFFQERLGDMDTVDDGDGDFNNIEEVRIVAADGDVDLALPGLNLDKMSRYDLGTTSVENDDDEFEDETIYEVDEPGAIEVTDLGSLDEAFESATIHDLSMPVIQSADDLSGEDVEASFEEDEENNYPGYHGTAEIHVRNGLEDAYDLSYSNVELVDEQTLGSDRYMMVGYAEDVGDEAFDDLEEDDYDDLTDSYDDQGEEVSLDSTVQPGDDSVVMFELRLNENEFNALQEDDKPAAAGGGFWSTGGSGPFGTIGNWIAAAFATLAGSLALIRRRASDTVGE
ncbi:MAG: hypothetical protein ACOCUO_00460 [archaeon]